MVAQERQAEGQAVTHQAVPLALALATWAASGLRECRRVLFELVVPPSLDNIKKKVFKPV